MSYKSITEIKQIVSFFLARLDSRLLTGRIDMHTLINKIVLSSKDFCESLEKKQLLFGTQIGSGGNGSVSALYENLDGIATPVWVNETSTNPNRGGWNTDYSRVVIKKNNVASHSIFVRFDKLTNTFYSPDPIHEALVQGLVTDLYDNGITPHVISLYATYICGKALSLSMYSIIQKADFPLSLPIIKLDKSLIMELFTYQNLVTWTIQIAWTFYCLKLHYNICHEDMHAGNMLLVDTQNPENDFVFGGKYMSEIDSLRYVIDSENSIVVPKTRYFLKVADYGYTECSIPLVKSVVKLHNTNENKIFGYDQLLKMPELFNGLETSYAMRTFAVLMSKMIDIDGMTGLASVLEEYSEFCKVLDNTFDYKVHRYNIYPSTVILDNQLVNPLSTPTTMKGQGGGIIRFRGWGEKDLAINSHLVRTVNYFKSLDSFVKIENTNYKDREGVLTCVAVVDLKYDRSYVDSLQTSVQEYINCQANSMQVDGRKQLCDYYKSEMAAKAYSNYYSDKISGTTVDRKSGLLDNYRNLYSRIPIENDIMSKFIVSRVGTCIHYEMIIEPKLLGTIDRTAFSYKPYQLDVQRKVPRNVGKPMEQINLHFVVTSPNDVSLIVDEKVSLVEAISVHGYDSSVNGGYFIVDGNVANKLTQYLTKEDLNKPIGYFCSRGIGATILPIPLPYELDFAVIVQIGNSIKIVPYLIFMNMHRISSEDILLIGEDEKIYVVAQKKIRTDRGRPLLLNEKNRYDNAFCAGPYLIYDGKPTFTEDKMLNDEMVLERCHYAKTSSAAQQVRQNFKLDQDVPIFNNPDPKMRFKINPQQKNYKKFFSEPGESNFLYGQRAGNTLHINAAMCTDFEGNTFFAFCEGRGNNAPGIDRAQFTYLLSKMSVKVAVAIDGGFSANWVYKDDSSDFAPARLLLYSTQADRKLGSLFGLK